jgi:hypothetical protein
LNLAQGISKPAKRKTSQEPCWNETWQQGAARMFAALNKFAMLLSKKGERMKRSQTTHRSMFTVRYRLSFLKNSFKSEQNLGRKVELCSSDKSRVKISEFPFSKVELLIFSLTKKS